MEDFKPLQSTNYFQISKITFFKSLLISNSRDGLINNIFYYFTPKLVPFSVEV